MSETPAQRTSLPDQHSESKAEVERSIVRPLESAIRQPSTTRAPAAAAPANIPDPGRRGHPLRAPSVHYIETTFLREIEVAGLTRDAKIYEIEEHVVMAKGRAAVCPRDGRLGSAYIDAVLGEDDACNAGAATHLLSYPWGSSAGDVADALGVWCRHSKLDPKKTYIWMCCLCVNQHRVHKASPSLSKDMNSVAFTDALRRLLNLVGNVLALLQPWTNPGYLQRTWCMYELYTAFQLVGKCNVEIIMPPRDAHGFQQALRNGNPGLARLQTVLSSIRVEDANASVPADKDNILRAIEKGPGVTRVDKLLSQQLKLFFADLAEAHAKNFAEDNCANELAATELAGACCRAADMLGHLGKHQRVMAILETAHDALVKSNQMATPAGAKLMRRIGDARNERGDTESTLAAYEEAREIHTATNTLETTPEGAHLLMCLGMTRGQRGDSEGALISFDTARRVRETTGTLETPHGAILLTYIGHAKGHRRDFEGALVSYKDARRIREVTRTLETSEGAALLTNIGQAKGQRGDFEGALASYELACQIRESTGTLNTPHGASLLTNLGIAKHQRGDAKGALASYEAARRIRERLGISHPDERQSEQSSAGSGCAMM